MVDIEVERDYDGYFEAFTIQALSKSQKCQKNKN